jgi:hypothetical protein
MKGTLTEQRAVQKRMLQPSRQAGKPSPQFLDERGPNRRAGFRRITALHVESTCQPVAQTASPFCVFTIPWIFAEPVPSEVHRAPAS